MAEISAQAVKTLRDRTGAGMMDCKKALSEAGGDFDRAVEVLRERGLAKAGKRSGRVTSEGSVGIAIADGAAGIVELGCETDFVAKTDDFQKLLEGLAGHVAANASVSSADAFQQAEINGEAVKDRISSVIAKLGENIVVKRVARITGEGAVSGYVHAGGKLGVIVGLRTTADAAKAGALARDVAMHVAAADPTPIAVDRSGVPKDLVERERAIYGRQAEQEGKPTDIIDRIVDGKLKKFYSGVCLVEQPFVKDPDRRVGKLLEDAGNELESEVSVTEFVRFKLGEADAE